MILNCIATKYGKSIIYVSDYSVMLFAGKATEISSIPEVPRLPMFPEQMIERTWIEYFRTMHKLVEKHLSDFHMHKRK